MSFIGLRWTPGDRDCAKAAARLCERLGEAWNELIVWRGLILLHRGGDPVEILPHGMGFVFGRRWGELELDPSPPCGVCVDPVQGWVEQRWGAYVAVLIDRGYDRICVLRDPSGARPCFFAALDGVHVFFSEANDFVTLGSNVSPDLGFVRSFLRYPPHLGRRTGLVGVDELAPGECAVYAREERRLEVRWTPRTVTKDQPRLDWCAGMTALRQTTEACIEARTAKLNKIGLRLSGGFDSSIMLGLLRRCSEAEIVCVNEYWEGAPEGDERAQARCVAEASGLALQELRFDPASVRYERALTAPLSVRPTLSILGYADPSAGAFYADLNCELVTSGQGGDHLFHRSRSTWIAADALWDRVGCGDAFDIALATARLTGRPVWDVFATMLVGAVGLRPETTRLSEVMGSLIDGDSAPLDHVWVQDARGVSPARVLRIQQLLHALGYFEDSTLSAAARIEPLLLSQPIVEVCLRIPPYVMTQGGTERALARAAFADLAPPNVTERASKGETTRYFAAVLAANADWIRSVLIGGRLVEHGVIDGVAIKTALARDWVQNALAADGLYALIAAECWLRNLERACASARVKDLAM